MEVDFKLMEFNSQLLPVSVSGQVAAAAADIRSHW